MLTLERIKSERVLERAEFSSFRFVLSLNYLVRPGFKRSGLLVSTFSRENTEIAAVHENAGNVSELVSAEFKSQHLVIFLRERHVLGNCQALVMRQSPEEFSMLRQKLLLALPENSNRVFLFSHRLEHLVLVLFQSLDDEFHLRLIALQPFQVLNLFWSQNFLIFYQNEFGALIRRKHPCHQVYRVCPPTQRSRRTSELDFRP